MENEQTTCTWTYDDIYDVWETSCRDAWVMTEGGLPSLNHFNYCPSCGKRIIPIVNLEPEQADPDA